MIRRLAHLFVDNYGATGAAESTTGNPIPALSPRS